MKKCMNMFVFGMLCAATLVLAAACNNGDDGTPAKDIDTSYTVGNIVPFEGKNYLVTKNTETAARSAARASVNSDSGLYYQNEQAAAYREERLRDYGMTEYVELFDITTRKDMYRCLTANSKPYISLRSDRNRTGRNTMPFTTQRPAAIFSFCGSDPTERFG